MSPFTRPELVLRRCDELLSVNQPLAALSAISEVFSSKRFRTTPLSTLEPILIKFLTLCVELRKGRTAKEGLHMYKNVAQNTSVGSVEVVIQKFLEQSRAKLMEALAKVDELEGPAEKAARVEGIEANDVEDLEASETPESILLSSVSEEKSRDRTYRTLVTPWLRFLWEAYRTALDILRNNARLEVLYQTVSHEAFTFCLTHTRKTEFRRLSETLRSHLTSSQKYSHQSHSINLNDPDTLQRHLDTRFQQLNTAVDLELWQEAFRTAEDIHGLVGMSKRAPKASMMATFYDKMVQVFGVGQNYLFHAAAYGKLYSLQADRVVVSGGAEDVELEKLSSLVLLSALAVPIGSGLLGEGGKRRDTGDEGEAKGKLGRLAALLGLAAAPTRSGLIADALNRHVLKRVSPELRELYNILEVDFHPLSITSKIEPILTLLESSPETARYVEPLKEVVLARLFQQLAQVYASLKIDRVVKLASFEKDGEKEVTRKRVERFVTEACRRGDLDITIDHSSGSIQFDQDLFGTDAASPVASTSSQTYDSVKILQPSASTLLRTHLTRLAETLFATLDIVSPDDSPIASAISSRVSAFATLEAQGKEERENLLARTLIIKRRKELADEQTARKEKADALERTVAAARKVEEDAKRLKEEARKKELDRIQKELAAKRTAEAAALAKTLVANNGLKIDLKDVENQNIQKDDLVLMQVQQLEKEKKDLAQKLTGVSKRIDHLERAFRKEEIPLLQKDYERQQTRDREAHQSAEITRVESSRRQHAEDLAIKSSLVRIMADYAAFRQNTERESLQAFEERKAQMARKLEDAKDKRREERAYQRQQEEAQKLRREEERAEFERRQAEQDALDEEANAAEAAAKAEIEQRQQALAEEVETRRAARQAERDAENAAAVARMALEEEAAARKRNGGRAPIPSNTSAIPGTAAWKASQTSTPSSSGERPKLALAPRTTAPPAPIVPAVRAATVEPTPLRSSGPPSVVAPGARPSWRDKESARSASGTSTQPPPPAAASATAPGPSNANAPPARGASGTWASRRDAPSSDGSRTPQDGSRTPSGAQGGAYKAPAAQEGRKW